MSRKISSAILILVISLASTVSAQWIKSFAINTSYDDNAFRNFRTLGDYITEFSAYLAREGGSEDWQWRAFYRGGFNYFSQYQQRSFHYHQTGLALAKKFDEGKYVLNFGANVRLRANQKEYNYYNFKQTSLYGNLKVARSASSTIFGYRLRVHSYTNLPELSYIEHYFFVRQAMFLPTRTSVTVEANYGHKTYQQAIASTPGFFQNPEGYGHHRGGMGHWMGGNNFNSFNPSLNQFVASIRGAQSLTLSTGLSFEALIRRNSDSAVRYLAGQVYGYTTEDDLFDDRYGYESEELAFTLTQLLPWSAQFRLGMEYQWKDYLNRPALDLNGEPLSTGELRRDTRAFIWQSLVKPFRFGHEKSLNISGEVVWIDNRSNDLYYDYKVLVFSLGISTSL